MSRLLAILAVCVLALSACGSTSAPVRTFPAYQGPPVPPPVPVSDVPGLAAADHLCRASIPGLRPTILSTYTLDGESLSVADLTARAGVYTAAAQRLRTFAARLSRSNHTTTVRGLAGGLKDLAAALKVLGKSVGELPTLGGNANLPGAQAAIAEDVAGITPYALQNSLPDCAP